MKRRAILRVVVAVVIAVSLEAVDGLTGMPFEHLAHSIAVRLSSMLSSLGMSDQLGVHPYLVFAPYHAMLNLIPITAYLLLGLIPYFRTRTPGCNCRKCGHTLRGLSEPKCPECGEAI